MDDLIPFKAKRPKPIRQAEARRRLLEYLLSRCDRDDGEIVDSSIERYTGIIIFAMKKPHLMYRTVDFEFDARTLPKAANW